MQWYFHIRFPILTSFTTREGQNKGGSLELRSTPSVPSHIYVPSRIISPFGFVFRGSQNTWDLTLLSDPNPDPIVSMTHDSVSPLFTGVQKGEDRGIRPEPSPRTSEDGRLTSWDPVLTFILTFVRVRVLIGLPGVRNWRRGKFRTPCESRHVVQTTLLPSKRGTPDGPFRKH